MKKQLIHDDTEIECVMTKIMTFGKFKELLQGAKQKGWDVKSYQIGFFQRKKIGE